MDSTAIKKLDNGCANSSVWPSTRTVMRTKGGIFRVGRLEATSLLGFPEECGKPLVFGGKEFITDPDPGYGWLWTMMIRDPSVGPENFRV